MGSSALLIRGGRFASFDLNVSPRILDPDAQHTGKVFRIDFMDGSTAAGMAALVEVFRQGLHKLGWSEGKNITIDTGLRTKDESASPNWQPSWFDLKLI